MALLLCFDNVNLFHPKFRRNYLYIKGSRSSDNFKEIVSHHDITANERKEFTRKFNFPNSL